MKGILMMRGLLPLALFAMLIGSAVQETWAGQKRFVIVPPTTVSFTSDAPIELIKGQTQHLEGTIRYDDRFVFSQRHPFEIHFNVPLNTLDTGIPLRNEHMRERFLETSRYPNVVFKVNQVVTQAKPPFRKGQVIHLTALGDFSLHGRTVKKKVPLTITYGSNASAKEVIRIQGKFPVALAEHGIQRPEALFQKLAETVYVDVDTYAHLESPSK